MGYYLANPNDESAALFFSILDKPVFGDILALQFENVGTMEIFHLLKREIPLTLDNIEKLPKYKNWED